MINEKTSFLLRFPFNEIGFRDVTGTEINATTVNKKNLSLPAKRQFAKKFSK